MIHPHVNIRKQRPSILLHDENGSYSLEMALILPTFLMTVFLFIACSLLLFVYGNITFACRSAVRYAAVHSSVAALPCSTADLQQQVSDAVLTTGGGALSTTANWPAGNIVGGTVTVTSSITFPAYLPFIGNQDYTLASSSTGTIIH